MVSPLDTRPPASRQLAELLLGLAGLMHRLRTLPEGHPTLHGQALALERALAVTLAGRERLVMEVGTVQLVVEGMETNPDYEPLRDLAADLRRAGLASLEFRAGVTATELLEALTPLVVVRTKSGERVEARPARGVWGVLHSSDMQRAALRVEHALMHHLAQRWVREHGRHEISFRQFRLLADHEALLQLRHSCTDQMRAK